MECYVGRGISKIKSSGGVMTKEVEPCKCAWCNNPNQDYFLYPTLNSEEIDVDGDDNYNFGDVEKIYDLDLFCCSNCNKWNKKVEYTEDDEVYVKFEKVDNDYFLERVNKFIYEALDYFDIPLSPESQKLIQEILLKEKLKEEI